jgi:peptidoglycan/LPS O-acetylase OafA/YrhL
MRAVAVLTVFANHLFDWPSGGFAGVDVFFVLSGFFITGILVRERSTQGKLSFQRFYIRRVKRILPSAMLVLVATVAGGYLLFSPIRAKETLVDALYAAIFASNFRFQAIGADYFEIDQPPSPLQHYWSLSIEEQFYFVWPFLLVVIFAITRTWKHRGHAWIRQWGLFGSMAAVVAGSFGWAMVLSSDDRNSAYFSTFTRVWELGIGALLAIAGPWFTRIPSAIRPGLAYLGLAGVLGSMFLIDATFQWPAPWALLPIMSTALVVASFHGGEVRGMFPLTNPVARFFGDTSYTLYLWHWPVIILLLTVLPKGPVFYGAVIVLALGLTAVTYRFYEDPIRKSNWLLPDPAGPKNRRFPRLTTSRWAFVGAVMVAVVVLSTVGIHDNVSIPQDDDGSVDQPVALLPPPSGPLTSKVVVPRIVPVPGADPCFGAPAMTDARCALWNPDLPLKPGIHRFARDFVGSGGPASCWGDQHAKVLHPCTLGYEGADAIRIALVGDSHAQRVLRALAPALIPLKWQLTSYLGWGCEWRDHPDRDALCADAMDGTQKELLAHPYDMVITTSSRLYGSRPIDFANAWKPVAGAGSRIAVVGDVPGVSEESLACLTRVNTVGSRIGGCGTSRAEAFARPDPLIEASRLVSAATLIDLTQYYCTADRCPSVIGNAIVYSDWGAHVTATYIRTLSPAIIDGVRQALTARTR